MGKRKGFTFQNEMLLSYIVVILSMILIGVVGIYYMGKVYNNGKDIYANNLKAVEYLKSISENLKGLDKCIFRVLIDAEWENDEHYEEQIDDLIADNNSLIDMYAKLDISSDERMLYEQGKKSVENYHKHIRDILSSKQGVTESELLTAYKEKLLPVKEETNGLIEEAVALAVSNAEQKNRDNHSIFTQNMIVICICMFVAIIVALVIAFKMCNVILTKLKSVQMMAKRMAEYDISNDMEFVEDDIFGQTAEALRESQFMGRELIGKIIDESETISDMGKEISLAIRKSEQRVETVNVRVLEYEKLAEEIEISVKRFLDDRTMSDEEQERLSVVKEKLERAKVLREQARTELSSIATYLEQIGITADSQNEITNEHQSRVSKFKLKESEEE